jgi:hypothetical protein
MVSKSTLKAYDFETIEDYYDYIVLSKINGQHGQVESLIKAMSKEQKKDCLIWLDSQSYDVADSEYCKTILIQQL